MKNVKLAVLEVAILLFLLSCFAGCVDQKSFVQSDTQNSSVPSVSTEANYTMRYTTYVSEQPFGSSNVIVLYVITRVEGEKEEVVGLTIKTATMEVSGNVVITKNSALSKADIIDSNPLALSATFAIQTGTINGTFTNDSFEGKITKVGNEVDVIAKVADARIDYVSGKWSVKFHGQWVDEEISR